jgi:hypothetical protein
MSAIPLSIPMTVIEDGFPALVARASVVEDIKSCI